MREGKIQINIRAKIVQLTPNVVSGYPTLPVSQAMVALNHASIDRKAMWFISSAATVVDASNTPLAHASNACFSALW